MASLLFSRYLVRKSLVRITNACVLQRTYSNITYKQCRKLVKINSMTKWLTIHNYSMKTGGSDSPGYSKGLADELLAAKVQEETKDNKAEDEQQSEQTSDAHRKEKENTYRTLKYSFLAFGVMIVGFGGFMVWTWGAPAVDLQGNILRDEFSELGVMQQYLRRTWQGMNDINKMIQEPSRDKLLPDPLVEPYIQPPYTLVLELRDVLVHPEWTYETGWRFKKRPGVEFLFHHCAPPLFEIVIYTNEGGFTAQPLIDHLDPNGYVWYRLFKDSTRYVEGKHVKDLSCLNRDLSKVICVDWDSGAVSNSRNHLKLSRWDGNMNDQTLLELGFMLRTIAESEVSDVREVMDYYRSFDDPLAAFRENQRRAQQQEVTQRAEEEEKHTRSIAGSWTSSFLKRR